MSDPAIASRTHAHAYSSLVTYPRARIAYERQAVNVTDPVSGAQTGCEAEHGPCVGNSVDPPKPEIPLDAGHPAACADPSFTFYLDVFGGIGNYSLAVRHASPSGGGGGGDGYDEEGGEVEGGGEDEDEDEEERFGVTGLINKENYGSSWHYSCGGSGFCDSVVSGVSIIAPFVSSYQ